MNVFFIRTRLQCLVASRIVETLVPDQPYHAVFLYQKSRNEDSPAVYAHYERFRGAALGSTDIVSADGLLRNVARIVPVLARSKRSGGCCYLAVVDSVPVAVALRLVRRLPVETFDDGFFNIHPGSRLFGMGPLRGRGLKRRLARALFPQGSTEWMRTRSRRHHTIFPGYRNIVPEGRVTDLHLDWSKLLDPSDRARVKPGVRRVVLGTAHQDFPDPPASRRRAEKLMECSDLYIRHPRETHWSQHSSIMDFQSPAEAVLEELAKQSPLIVYHFNSTAAVSLCSHDEISFVNLVNADTRELLIAPLR